MAVRSNPLTKWTGLGEGEWADPRKGEALGKYHGVDVSGTWRVTEAMRETSSFPYRILPQIVADTAIFNTVRPP